jgi:hypothetical protein
MTDDAPPEPYPHYRAACLGARIKLTPALQPARPPAPTVPSHPVPWRVWSRDADPADATRIVRKEPLDAAWAWMAARTELLATTVFVERADVDPAGSRALEFEVSSGVDGTCVVRRILHL